MIDDLDRENEARRIVAEADGDIGTAAAIAAMDRAEQLLEAGKITPLAYWLVGEAARAQAEGLSIVQWQAEVARRGSIPPDRLIREIDLLRTLGLLPWGTS